MRFTISTLYPTNYRAQTVLAQRLSNRARRIKKEHSPDLDKASGESLTKSKKKGSYS